MENFTEFSSNFHTCDMYNQGKGIDSISSSMNSKPSIDLCIENYDDKMDVMITNVIEEKPNDDISSKFSPKPKRTKNYHDKFETSKPSLKISSVNTLKENSKLRRNKEEIVLTKNTVTIKENFLIKTKRKERDYQLSNVAKRSKCDDNIQSLICKNISKNKNKHYNGMKILVNPKTKHYSVAICDGKFSKNDVFPIESWMFESPRILRPRVESLFILPKSKHKNNYRWNMCSENKTKEVSKSTCYEEGNMNSLIKNYISLTNHLKVKYLLFNVGNSRNHSMDSFQMPDYLGNMELYENPAALNNGAGLGVKVYTSWKKVEERIEALQEETMTKFIYKFKSKGFSDPPRRFTKLHFELDIRRRNVPVVIPYSSIPFIFVGIRIFDCHLGKKRNPEEKTSTMRKGTKKIGCPAQISVIKIARFPDFDISGLSSSCMDDAIKELRDAWEFTPSRVRYYIEYHVREPSAADHRHNYKYKKNYLRLQEPIDPRVLAEIRRLASEGEIKPKIIREKLSKFVQNELFKGTEEPPLDRRRYKPTLRDIQYAILKEKIRLKNEGKTLKHVHCSKIIEQIQSSVESIQNEETISKLISCLQMIRDTLKSDTNLKDSLEALKNALSEAVLTIPYTISLSSQKSSMTKETPFSDVVNPPPSNPAVINEEILFTEQLVEDDTVQQFYINVPDVTSTNESVFSPQIYGSELVNINQCLESLQSSTDNMGVAEVYYYYPEGSCELTTTLDSLKAVQH